MTIKLGKYKHYKQKYYEVIAVAKHSETFEDMVIYRKLYDDFDWRVRPLSLFVEDVEIDGKMVPRFEYIGEMEAKNLSPQG